MSSPTDPPFEPPEDRSFAGRSGGSNVPPWDPSVPVPREGADGWATPSGGPVHEGYGSGFGSEPGAGYVPGYGDPYGAGRTSGPTTGPNPYGTGGPFGPGSGGWAPKPGIVPLRPLALGEILDGAVSYIRSHPRVVLGTSAVVAVIAYLVGTPLSLIFGGDVPTPGPTANLGALSDTLAANASARAPLVVVVSLATTLLSGLLMVVISRAVLGAPIDGAEAWRAARPRLPGLIGLVLLTGLLAGLVALVGALPGILLLLAGVTVAGAILVVLGVLAGFVAALALGVGLSLAPPVYVLEGGGVVEALKRSWALVRPRFWPVLGITVLSSVIAYIVSIIAAVPFGALTLAATTLLGPGAATSVLTVLLEALGGIVGMILVTPFQAGVTGLLYVDQRMRREGFDIELQRAASSGPR